MKVKNKRNIECVLLLVLIVGFICWLFEIEKEQEELENSQVGLVADNEILPTPDRIIYKNQNNEYIMIYANTKEYSKIYSELYNRTTNLYEGKIYSEEEIKEMQNAGSFIEFDYNSKSKNFVFLLEEHGIGIIRRFSESGQVIKNSLSNTEKLIKKINKWTKNKKRYDFNKEHHFISKNKLSEVPKDLGFSQVRVGVYQKIINYNEDDYKNIIEKLNFETDKQMPNINFNQQTVIITLSQYEIKQVTQNIGNIKYEFGKLLNEYTGSMLLVSKIVNTNCMYYNIKDSNEFSTTNELDKYVETATSGIITNLSENTIEIGLHPNIGTHIVKIGNHTKMINYETNSEITIADLRIGDSIYIEGETAKAEGDLKGIDASRIEICSNHKMRNEVEKFLKDTYRIDGMGIDYVSVDSAGSGFIIVGYSFEKFIYPLKLKVNSRTETFLGMSYHIQSNYGYILHEMCDITLDTKITNIDNITGFVNTIEYIAD